jgi:pyruvate dehydrogenase E1 component alpha subunit
MQFPSSGSRALSLKAQGLSIPCVKTLPPACCAVRRRFSRTKLQEIRSLQCLGVAHFPKSPLKGQADAKPMETPASATDYSAAPINQALSPEQKLNFLREMLRIRRFEQAALKQYSAGKMGGFLHLYIGQESVAVGTVSLMGQHDHVITAYRDHGHALAVGMNMNECMAELFGKVTGCSKGKGGSMHYFAPDKNYWGGHGIVGGQTPLGLGLAYGVKYKGQKGAALCFMGDGAVNQGCFYESLNLASLWNLPVIYIIENNHYSMGTSLNRSSAFRSCLAERAEGFAIDWATCNGEDLYTVRAKTHEAMQRAHEQSRPTVLEIETYRYYGHSVADAKHKVYRSEDEIERYKQNHDPIQLWKARLLSEGVLTEEKYEAIDSAAREEAQAGVEFAEASPLPSEASILEDVYCEVDRKSPAGLTGRHFFNN